MPSRHVTSELNTGTYYLTLTVQRWYYLFDRHNRWHIANDQLPAQGGIRSCRV
jgi:putative transposase